ncbi:MAG: hypothetical protein ACOX6J_00060 [Oscillospiraceae bacterium]
MASRDWKDPYSDLYYPAERDYGEDEREKEDGRSFGTRYERRSRDDYHDDYYDRDYRTYRRDYSQDYPSDYGTYGSRSGYDRGQDYGYPYDGGRYSRDDSSYGRYPAEGGYQDERDRNYRSPRDDYGYGDYRSSYYGSRDDYGYYRRGRSEDYSRIDREDRYQRDYGNSYDRDGYYPENYGRGETSRDLETQRRREPYPDYRSGERSLYSRREEEQYRRSDAKKEEKVPEQEVKREEENKPVSYSQGVRQEPQEKSRAADAGHDWEVVGSTALDFGSQDREAGVKPASGQYRGIDAVIDELMAANDRRQKELEESLERESSAAGKDDNQKFPEPGAPAEGTRAPEKPFARSEAGINPDSIFRSLDDVSAEEEGSTRRGEEPGDISPIIKDEIGNAAPEEPREEGFRTERLEFGLPNEEMKPETEENPESISPERKSPETDLQAEKTAEEPEEEEDEVESSLRELIRKLREGTSTAQKSEVPEGYASSQEAENLKNAVEAAMAEPEEPVEKEKQEASEHTPESAEHAAGAVESAENAPAEESAEIQHEAVEEAREKPEKAEEAAPLEKGEPEAEETTSKPQETAPEENGRAEEPSGEAGPEWVSFTPKFVPVETGEAVPETDASSTEIQTEKAEEQNIPEEETAGESEQEETEEKTEAREHAEGRAEADTEETQEEGTPEEEVSESQEKESGMNPEEGSSPAAAEAAEEAEPEEKEASAEPEAQPETEKAETEEASGAEAGENAETSEPVQESAAIPEQEESLPDAEVADESGIGEGVPVLTLEPQIDWGTIEEQPGEQPQEIEESEEREDLSGEYPAAEVESNAEEEPGKEEVPAEPVQEEVLEGAGSTQPAGNMPEASEEEAREEPAEEPSGEENLQQDLSAEAPSRESEASAGSAPAEEQAGEEPGQKPAGSTRSVDDILRALRGEGQNDLRPDESPGDTFTFVPPKPTELESSLGLGGFVFDGGRSQREKEEEKKKEESRKQEVVNSQIDIIQDSLLKGAVMSAFDKNKTGRTVFSEEECFKAEGLTSDRVLKRRGKPLTRLFNGISFEIPQGARTVIFSRDNESSSALAETLGTGTGILSGSVSYAGSEINPRQWPSSIMYIDSVDILSDEMTGEEFMLLCGIPAEESSYALREVGLSGIETREARDMTVMQKLSLVTLAAAENSAVSTFVISIKQPNDMADIDASDLKSFTMAVGMLSKKNKTFIMNDFGAFVASSVCNYVVALDGGSLAFCGDIADFCDRYGMDVITFKADEKTAGAVGSGMSGFSRTPSGAQIVDRFDDRKLEKLLDELQKKGVDMRGVKAEPRNYLSAVKRM